MISVELARSTIFHFPSKADNINMELNTHKSALSQTCRQLCSVSTHTDPYNQKSPCDKWDNGCIPKKVAIAGGHYADCGGKDRTPKP